MKRVLLLGALILLPLGLFGAFHLDEIHALRLVTDFGTGRSRSVRPGLLWLLLKPVLWLGSPVAAALGARLLAVAVSLGTLAAVGRLSRGWLAPALLLTSASWLSHAFEVRTDTFTTALTLAAAALLLGGRSMAGAVGGGLCIAAMGLMSQKTAFNAAGLGLGWLWVGRGRLRLEAPRMAATAATTLVVVGLWYAFAGGAEQLAWQVDRASATAFSGGSHGRRWQALGMSAVRGPAVWLGALAGVVLWRRAGSMAQGLALVGCTMVASIAAHKGFRVYYAASMEPMLAPLAAVALGALPGRVRVGALAVAGGLALGWMVPVASIHNGPQRAVMAEAHAAFGEPVPYWDSVGSVPGYPESTWFGTAGVRRAWRSRLGKKAFVLRARERKPHFFVKTSASRTFVYGRDERRWLWRHYLPYRDNLWLHGGRIARTGPESAGTAELLVDGPYTVWFRGGWTGAATVDGVAVEHGQVVAMTAGKHRLKARGGSGDGVGGELWLLLGADRVPAAEHVDWSMFPRDSRDRYRRFDTRGNRAKAELLTPPSDRSAPDFEARQKRHRRWHRAWDAGRGAPKGKRSKGGRR